MLFMKADVKNEKVLLKRIRSQPEKTEEAIKRAMSRVGKGVFRSAYDWLSGRKNDTGGFPVPVVTGHLRRQLAWLKPGQTKSAGGDAVTAGPMESIVYDTAAYADVIAEGRGSSAKFGPRDYLEKALEDFNQGDQISKILDDELEAAWP